jgi:branched-chain amino acid transport system ATP-binding protein
MNDEAQVEVEGEDHTPDVDIDRRLGASLAVSDLEVAYGDALSVLHGIDLVVPAGRIVALLGANGAGKTTLLRAISGLIRMHRGRITAGTVLLDGREIQGSSPAAIVRGGLAQVMEGRRIFAELTVEENLRAGAATRKDKAGIAASFDEVVTLFPKLAERRKQVAGYLSGGEQQMVAMGRALMAAPRLLVLDEPSLGLAPLIVQQIFDAIGRIAREEGVTIFLVEQNAYHALRLADRGYVLVNGRVRLSGRGGELLANAEVRAAYLEGGQA